MASASTGASMARHRTRPRATRYHPVVAHAASPPGPEARPGGLAGLTPSGRAIVPVSWSLYDFANTIFSFAVVSGAIGLYLVKPEQFGERDGNVVLSVAVAISVGINAIVSPILGAISDRGGRRMPFLLFFTLLCIAATFFIADVPAGVGLTLFIVANFAYQAALIYYDATLKSVSYPETRGRLSGIGTGIGYCGTVVVGLLIFLLDIPVEDRFRLTAVLFLVFAIPIFLVVREPRHEVPPMTAREMVAAFGQLRASIQHARAGARAWGASCVGRFFYSDAVNTVIVVMSVVTVKALGVSEATANVILLRLTLVAIVMSFVWGALADRHRAQADPRHRPRLVGRRARPRRGVARLRARRAGPVPRGRGDPRLRARGRDRRRPGAHGPAVAARAARRVLRPVRAGRQGLAGRRPAALRRDHPAALRRARERRLPGRRAQPARDDAHRAVAGLAGPRRLGGQRRGARAPDPAGPAGAGQRAPRADGPDPTPDGRGQSG